MLNECKKFKCIAEDEEKINSNNKRESKKMFGRRESRAGLFV